MSGEALSAIGGGGGLFPVCLVLIYSFSLLLTIEKAACTNYFSSFKVPVLGHEKDFKV
jgi:hypothetical protein